MKAITCELCGSNQFTKVEGFFQCEHCGTRYTPDEAKKLIVSGTVEIVTGESEKHRLLKNAESLIKIHQIDEAGTIYRKIVDEYPDETKAWVGLIQIILEYNKNFLHGKVTQGGYTYQTRYIFDGFSKIIEILLSLDYDINSINRLKTELYDNIIKGKTQSEGKYASSQDFLHTLKKCIGNELTKKLFKESEEKAYLYKELKKNIIQKSFVDNFRNFCYSFDNHTRNYGILDGYTGHGSNLVFCIGSIFGMYENGALYVYTSPYMFRSNQELKKELQMISERDRINNKCCRYCGGSFKGLFTKVCSKCGKPKDY